MLLKPSFNSATAKTVKQLKLNRRRAGMGAFRLPTFRSECMNVELEDCITSPFPVNPRSRAFKVCSSKVSIKLSSTTILLPIFADDILQYADGQKLLNKNLVRVFCMVIYPAKSLDTATRMYFYVVPQTREGEHAQGLKFRRTFQNKQP